MYSQFSADYCFGEPNPTYSQQYLAPHVLRLLREHGARRVFDMGCGNGAFDALLFDNGFDVSGIDFSKSGITLAKQRVPHLDLRLGSVYDDIAANFGQFPAVISLEVIEHLYDPPLFARRMFEILEPGGLALVSTPYHGYLKNIAIVISGNFDKHFQPMDVHGHIKFWSERTLGELLRIAGLEVQCFIKSGRIPWLAKSMIAVAKRPT
jgi:2-polyprenyl-6-hydroxyphenyl methylase/3-demethylubiquinone-9 3-methyltransferase